MFVERTGLRLCRFGIIDFDMDFLISIIAFKKKIRTAKFTKSPEYDQIAGVLLQIYIPN